MRQNEEVLLAWEMNGQPLPKIHGAPLRVVVTGYIGARSTKWVYQINALSVPSYGPVQRAEYLYYNQQVRMMAVILPAYINIRIVQFRSASTTRLSAMVSPSETCPFRTSVLSGYVTAFPYPFTLGVPS